MHEETFAAIDLGTNTFHILIAKKIIESPNFEVVFKERHYVYLGRSGVGKISEESFQLGIKTIATFKSYLQKYKVDKYKMHGTAALRSASNGRQFVSEVKEKTDLEIEIIEGEREADLIFKGVQAFLGKIDGSNLIMDIGGGSVEFIHFDTQGKRWASSFKVGISVLYNAFQKSDPINKVELKHLHEFLDEQLQPLVTYFKDKEVDNLIGSAGSFEVVVGILQERIDKDISEGFSKASVVKVYGEVLPLSYEERLSYPGIPEPRARLIPIGLILIEYILRILNIDRVVISPYALKEGVISELVQS